MAAPMSTDGVRNAAKFSSKFCVMHIVCKTKSNFISFTNDSWKKFVKFAVDWKKYDGKERDAVEETAEKLGLDFDNRQSCIDAQPTSANVGYHYDCYGRFCDISKIRRKENARKKKSVIQHVEDGGTDMNELDSDAIKYSRTSTEDDGEPSRKRVLRSETVKSPRSWNRRHMFPDECLLCHSNVYKRESFSGKRKLVRLVKCELVNGGQLLQAARQKEDTSLLPQIEGEDLVARELQYHHGCYKDYVRFLSKPSKPLTPIQNGYMQAFLKFSEETIRARLIVKKEILTLARLNKIFIRTIKEVDGVDAPYRTWHLKKRLQKAFPQLIFLTPSKRTMSDIVFCESLSAEDLAEDVVDNTSSAESSTDDEDDYQPSNKQTPRQAPDASNHLHTLYNAALVLKTSIQSNQPSSPPWPPTAVNLSLTRAKDIIPHQLFNFLAWIVGASSDPESTDYVDIPEDCERKLLSIAQDIVYLTTKAKQQMPKHTALATAVRHLTGSAQLIEILNGLGHSIAHTTLMEHNTALAKRQINLGDDALPPGIQPHKFTTLVWDNIDFGEETLSGKGTTHSTNGIMIQRQSTEPHTDTADTQQMKRTRERTLKPPPTNLEPFMGHGKKKGPTRIGDDMDTRINRDENSEVEGRTLDMAYNLLKFRHSCIPGWTGFNTMLTHSLPRKSVVAYLPVLNASPTHMDTVQTILARSIKYADALGQQSVVVVFDQAIYAKAQQIRWRDSVIQERLVLRLGMFHTKMTYLACIGKRYKDAGLADLMIESGLIAQGSLNGVINGHHYNRAMRAHKVMHDALRHLQLEAYMDTLDEDQQHVVDDVANRLQVGFTQQDISEVVNSQAFIDTSSSFAKFIDRRSKENPTFAFWSSYINMVENILLLTRATRTGNWKLHLSLVRRILPWMFAYDRPNYARYLSAYYLEMCDLPKTHPSAYEALASGEFAVQRQEDHGFAQVECDMCIEQTCNRDAKTKGGLIGFTTNPGAVLRWLLTQHECSAITNECKSMAGKDGQARKRKDLDISRISRDEKDVEAMITTIRSMVNPFEVEGEELIHISSGLVAPENVKQDLIMAECHGTDAFIKFCTERLQADNDAFFKPIKRQNLATFQSTTKKTVSKIKGKTVTLKADRKLFARLIFIAKVRNVDLHKLMKYCLGPLPLPLATEQGALAKTNKASLMHHLEGSVTNSVTMDSIPIGSIWIVDGMAMLQQLHSPSAPVTFYHLAEFILQKLLKLAVHQQSSEVHFVTDTYPSISIKNTERGRRAATGTEIIKIQQNSTSQKRPTQWKKFLSAGENKEAFVSYLFHVWKQCPAIIYKNITIYIAHGNECHALRASHGTVETTPVQDLQCNHEEADTRLLLHASYAQRNLPTNRASQDPPAVVIKSLDTDVLVISLGCAQQILSPLLFHTGRGDTVRTLDLKSLQAQLGMDVCAALVGFHPFTGCDSVSGFFGKGKIKPYKLMIKNQKYIDTFKDLGTSFLPSDDVVLGLDKFICHMYGQENVGDVNDARYNMFRLGTHAEESLPPNKDSLAKHIMRANYQAAIFRRCLEQCPDVPSPDQRGWKIEDTGDEGATIQIDWGNLPAAPEDILELMQCNCKKKKCRLEPRAEVATGDKAVCCSEIGLRCTELCTCTGCDNHNGDLSDDEDEVDSDDDE